jgi:hypothetical protein
MMRAICRPLLFVLPAALAACVTSAPPPPPVVVTTPPQRAVIVTPPPVVYSGSSMAAPAAAMRLSAPEIQSLLANNTAVGVGATGVPYDVYFAGNGVAHFREPGLADTGSWRVLPDGNLCSTLPHVAQGVEHCYTVARYGNVILYQRPDGVAEGSIRVVTGNPLDL